MTDSPSHSDANAGRRVAVMIVVVLLLAGLAGVFVFNLMPPPSSGPRSVANGSTDNQPSSALANRANGANAGPALRNASSAATNAVEAPPPAASENTAPGTPSPADNTASGTSPNDKPKARVVGRILDVNGDPVVGMPVMLSPEGFITGGFMGTDCVSMGIDNPHMVTGPDGRFELMVNPGNTHYLMLAHHGRFIHATALGRWIHEARDVDLGDVVAHLQAELDGVVTGPDGESIEGATVVFERRPAEGEPTFPGVAYGTNERDALRPFLGPDADYKTDAAGRFSVGLAAGDYNVTIRATGWLTERQTLTLQEGMREALQFPLGRAFALTVKVTDSAGKPMADALVHVMFTPPPPAVPSRISGLPDPRLEPLPGSTRHTWRLHPDVVVGGKTSAAGEVTLSNIGEAPVRLVVRRPGHVTQIVMVNPQGRTEASATVSMPPSTRIVGEVREDGKAISYLSTDTYAQDDRFCAFDIADAATGVSRLDGAWIELKSGRFVIDGLPGGDYLVTARVGSRIGTLRVSTGPPPEQEVDPIELERD
ncbi:MAG: carboxypeptidase-like regulatory domain-containing protein [Planctomycetota bacterium]